jgi:hypothetical protein
VELNWRFVLINIFKKFQNLIAKLRDKGNMVCGPESDQRLTNKQVNSIRFQNSGN